MLLTITLIVFLVGPFIIKITPSKNKSSQGLVPVKLWSNRISHTQRNKGWENH